MEEKQEKKKKRGNETTIIESADGQKTTTIPKAFADARDWKGKDIIRWTPDARGGLYVDKVR